MSGPYVINPHGFMSKPTGAAHAPMNCYQCDLPYDAQVHWVVGQRLDKHEGLSTHEPLPTADPTRGNVQDLVIEDITERKRVGIERYGTPLQTFNGRDALIDLYQELLDAVMYTRQLIEERKG